MYWIRTDFLYDADCATMVAGREALLGRMGRCEADVMAKLIRFVALPTGEKARIVEAACYLLAVRMVFGLLPLRQALWVFGITQSQTVQGRISATEAQLIGRAIERAAKHVPFRAVCLQQAFAALLMLRRRGLMATVQLGLLRQGDELKAHAWSHCGEVPVTGVARADGFAPVAAFG
jgi:hypothetical protein